MKYEPDSTLTKLRQAEMLLHKQQEIINILSSENELLSSTILNKRLGKINEERRNLQQKLFVSESKQKKAEQDLKKCQDNFNDKFIELTQRLQDVKSKQIETNKYIMSEANKITEDKRKQLQKQYNSKLQLLEGQYIEKEETLTQKLVIRNKIILGIFVYAILITILFLVK